MSSGSPLATYHSISAADILSELDLRARHRGAAVSRWHASGATLLRWLASGATGSRTDHGDAGQHLVLSPRELSEHALRVVRVFRLAEQLAVERHDGVRGEHDLAAAGGVGARLDRGPRLGPRQAQHVRLGRLAVER